MDTRKQIYVEKWEIDAIKAMTDKQHLRQIFLLGLIAKYNCKIVPIEDIPFEYYFVCNTPTTTA